jgi:hypothetical protein
LIGLASLRASKTGHFVVKMRPFSRKTTLFSGEIRSFLTTYFSLSGAKRAFSRTLRVIPETEFHSVMTRVFFTFIASFSSPAT